MRFLKIYLFALILSPLISMGQTGIAKYDYQKKIGPNLYLVTLKNQQGIIDSLGNVKIPANYDRLDYANGLVIAKRAKLYGLVSLSKEIILPIEYDFVLERKHDRFLIARDEMWGLIDIAGKEIIPFQYRHINNYLDDFYLVKNREGLEGIYDFLGKNVLPEEYKFFNVDGDKIFATKDKVPMIINPFAANQTIILDSDTILQKQYSCYCVGELNNQIFTRDGKYGLLKSDGTVLIPPVYESLKNVANASEFIMSVNGKHGIVNFRNEIIKAAEYDEIEERKEFAFLKRKGKKDEIYTFKYN